MSERKLLTCKDRTWKMKLTIFLTNLVMKFACRPNSTVNRRFISLLDFKAPPSVKPINGAKTFDITVDPFRNLWFRLFVPTNTVNGNDLPVIIFFHGGGFALMSADSLVYDRLCRRFATELNAVVISVNYRLAPEHKYPSQYEDGFSVLQFIDCNPNFEGFPTNANLKNCFVGGDSAGGNMAHHVAVQACNYEFSNLKIIGVIAIQPGFGGEEKTESEKRLVRAPFLDAYLIDFFCKAVLPEGSDKDHPAFNVFGPKSVGISRLNFPATIVIVGGFDPLQDWQKRYYEGLKKCGKEAYLIEYPDAFHAFYSNPDLLETCLMINEVRIFIQNQSAKSSVEEVTKTEGHNWFH